MRSKSKNSLNPQKRRILSISENEDIFAERLAQIFIAELKLDEQVKNKERGVLTEGAGEDQQPPLVAQLNVIEGEARTTPSSRACKQR